MGKKNRRNQVVAGDHDPAAVPAYHDEDERFHENQEYGESYYYSEDSPITKDRSCTDVLCLGLFFAFLGGWGFVAYLGFQSGDIVKVIYPTDDHGRVCGHGQMIDRPNLLLFDIIQCLNPAALVSGCPTPQVCVSHCPNETFSPWGQAQLSSGIGDSVLKERIRPFCTLVEPEVFEKSSVKQLISDKICPGWYIESTSVLGRCVPAIMTSVAGDKDHDVLIQANETQTHVEVSKDNLTVAVSRLSGLLNIREFGERVFSDLSETWWMIGISLIGACILSFLWICLMRFLAGIMVWTSILVVFLGVGGLLGYCGYKLYFVWVSADPESMKNIFQVNWTPYFMDDLLKLRDTWLAFTIILGIIFLIIICIFIFLRERIQIAIALIEQGSKAVGQMFSSLFFPIIPFLLQLVVVGWFLMIAMYLASSGRAEYRVSLAPGVTCENIPACQRPESSLDDVPAVIKEPVSTALDAVTAVANPRGYYKMNDTCEEEEFVDCAKQCRGAKCRFVRYTENKDFSWLQAANVFGLYWGIFFFSAYGEMVLAGVFAQWYWTRDKDQVPSWTLARSMFSSAFFHLGTIAFGSLILAIIRFIRTMLEYVEKKLKKFNNDLTKCLLCCCKCCLWCLEKFMRFINRNAYIMCAMKGTNFCSSAQGAFNLLMRNLARVVVLDSVCDFLLFLGKLVIVLICGIVSFLCFGGYIPEIKDDIPRLNYMTPTVFIVIGSYLIASSFFGVYAMAVDTLFLCFLEDLERNDGTPERPYFMAKSLKKILGKMEKTAAQRDYYRLSPRP